MKKPITILALAAATLFVPASAAFATVDTEAAPTQATADESDDGDNTGLWGLLGLLGLAGLAGLKRRNVNDVRIDRTRTTI
ncbi:MAG TPA: WGxxGxxG family protein [Ilumatobacteraceae bacterium]